MIQKNDRLILKQDFYGLKGEGFIVDDVEKDAVTLHCGGVNCVASLDEIDYLFENPSAWTKWENLGDYIEKWEKEDYENFVVDDALGNILCRLEDLGINLKHIVYKTNNKRILVKYHDLIGKSSCSPTDTFNLTTGMLFALQRLIHNYKLFLEEQYYNEEVIKLKKEFGLKMKNQRRIYNDRVKIHNNSHKDQIKILKDTIE